MREKLSQAIGRYRKRWKEFLRELIIVQASGLIVGLTLAGRRSVCSARPGKRRSHLHPRVARQWPHRSGQRYSLRDSRLVLLANKPQIGWQLLARSLAANKQRAEEPTSCCEASPDNQQPALLEAQEGVCQRANARRSRRPGAELTSRWLIRSSSEVACWPRLSLSLRGTATIREARLGKCEPQASEINIEKLIYIS